jgi:ribosomal protein L25 (general stress protein Ctc)
MTNYGDQKIVIEILWQPNLFSITIYNKDNLCVKMDADMMPITKWLSHIDFDNLGLD